MAAFCRSWPLLTPLVNPVEGDLFIDQDATVAVSLFFGGANVAGTLFTNAAPPKNKKRSLGGIGCHKQTTPPGFTPFERWSPECGRCIFELVSVERLVQECGSCRRSVEAPLRDDALRNFGFQWTRVPSYIGRLGEWTRA
jgi:hypothetical protein